MSHQELHPVDPKLWQSCAGDSIKIPKLHSKVYYFPLEDQENNVEVVSSFKTLTRSDSNNGGAFSVPRGCANKIFPPLDLKAKPAPFQELSCTDVHGEVWKFRHIYSGAPQRHLITSGWSKFVDKKKLVVGDSLVFLKNSTGRIFIGIRRKLDASRSGKIKEKAVIEAAELAEKNKAFEIVYYPTVGDGDNFVVDANVVEDAMKINWNCGMRVKLPLKNDVSSKGTISNLYASSNHPWRMLQVKWDEPKVSENTMRLRVDPSFALSRRTERHSSVPMVEIPHSSIGSFNQKLMSCDTLSASTSSFSGTHNCSNKKVSPNSIKLFGAIIQLSVGSISLGSDINGDDGCKGSNVMEGINKTCTKITQ
ncbi:hypothetical protein TSUD_213160 [Trifolium subterraneum]|uniref:Auxin response factor n=1 Tax=Trifolium subterraneum TaxID=3900 RepID=A0A2Z6MYV3_TRISU|nr:hypothetical protein TSUD_213160 [Trifolium subterraneum]